MNETPSRRMTVRPRPALDSSLDFYALAAQLQDTLVEPGEKASQDEALMDALDVERHC
jgi:hypothetical protein